MTEAKTENKLKKLNIVYMGSPDFAVLPLKALLEAGYNISLVVTQPDRPKGRKAVLTPTPVKTFAISRNLPVISPNNVNEEAFLAQIKAAKPDLLVVTAFGQILKEPLLNLSPLGAVNIHASLLPKYRGAAPIHWAIINGEDITGITTMYMDKGLDTGDMILQQSVAIEPMDTIGTLHDKLARVGSELIVDTVALIADGLAPREPQENAHASYASKIDRSLEKIAWHKENTAVCNLIRGLSPSPAAYTLYEGQPLKIVLAALSDESSSLPVGTVYKSSNNKVNVVCGKGLLQLLKVKPAGKGVMAAVDWWRGQKKENALFE
ncbi:MAG: methionyl-tRNA formyltransferase [Clostridia bacterium]|nr:methionyl-tRNA formyltransferase [Clostridia bacterium]